MNFLKPKQLARMIAVFLAAIVCVAFPVLFTGCNDSGNQPNPPVGYKPPRVTPQVNSVTITYNNDTVQGVLSVDVSRGDIQLVAAVQKDEGADDALTFTSSVLEVATVDNEGKVSMLSAGESVITAECGGKKYSVVLVVTDSRWGSYGITVNGGRANVTTAAAGDIVTITPVIPAHKEFSDWSFSDSPTAVTWINGNTFKMPAGEVYVTAQFTDMLYTLTLVGAKVTADGGEQVQSGKVTGYDGERSPEYAITEYKYVYDTPLTISAAEPSSDLMFVGWDKDQINNRLDAEQVITDYAMPGEATTLWANFSSIETKQLIDHTTIKFPCTPIDGTAADADPDLEGCSGFTVNIPGGTAADAPDDYSTNIYGSRLDTMTGAHAIRAIFKNRGDKDVTVEVSGEYLGNRTTSGWVTVPAGQVVVKTFQAFYGFKWVSEAQNPYWGIYLRENVPSGDAVPLDFVAESALAYPKGDIMFAVTNGTQKVSLGGFSDKLGASRIWPDINRGHEAVLVGAAENYCVLPAVLTARLENLPEYNPDDPYVTVYIKVQNTAMFSASDITLAFGKDENPLNDDHTLKPDTKKVDFTLKDSGEIQLFAIRIPRSEADSDFYFSFIKLNYDTPDGQQPASGTYAINFIMMLTYNNGIGFSGEVI